MEVLLKRIQELASRKKQIGEEMTRIVATSELGGSEFGAGCLRLEDVYCVKGGRRYGPFGPYYYLYFRRAGKLEKRYVGKRADQMNVRLGAMSRFRELESEYKEISRLERRLMRGLGLS